MEFGVIVHGLIRNNDKFLFTKRVATAKFAPSLWDSPGGSLEIGESPEEGVVRETKEETGIEISVSKPIAVYSKIVPELDRQFINIIYLCEYLNGEIQLNSEHSAFRWLSLTEINQVELVDYLVDATKKFAKS